MDFVQLFFFITFIVGVLSNNSLDIMKLEPVEIEEEPPINTFIIDIGSKLKDSNLSEFNFNFQFSLAESFQSQFFAIDKQTGIIKTKRELDREIFCGVLGICLSCAGSYNCTLPLDILINGEKSVVFEVIILEKDEYAPIFSSSRIILNIDENTPPNFEYELIPAKDVDSLHEIAYDIAPDDLKISSDADYMNLYNKLNKRLALSATKPNKLSLILLEPFDYEEVKEFSFKIEAYDKMFKSNFTGSQIVTLLIFDKNDNYPVYIIPNNKDNYELSIDESDAISGKPLLTVKAIDKDSGENGLVKYSLYKDYENLFHMDHDTGLLSVSFNDSLDFERAPAYILIVKAQDCGKVNSTSSFVEVIVNINDVNDNKPYINLTINNECNLKDKNHFSIPETSISKRYIAEISVKDLDTGLNGKTSLELKQIKCKIDLKNFEKELCQTSEDFELVKKISNIYSLVTKKKLDRELYDKYYLDLIAVDFGYPSLNSTLKLKIDIDDINDNIPIFSQDLYVFNLLEEKTSFSAKVKDLKEWISVGFIEAKDDDLDVLEYHIEMLNQDKCKLYFYILKTIYFVLN